MTLKSMKMKMVQVKIISIIKRFLLFGQSIYVGGKIVFTHRKFIWFNVHTGYSLALWRQSIFRNGIAPQVARRYLQNSEWSQVIVGGSNFKNQCGAFVASFSIW